MGVGGGAFDLNVSFGTGENVKILFLKLCHKSGPCIRWPSDE